MGQSCDNSVVRVSLLCISSTCELELHSIKVFPCWAPWRVESAEDEVLFSAIMGLNKRKKPMLHYRRQKLNLQTMNKTAILYLKSFHASL